MQRREKILAAVAGGLIVVVWVVPWAYRTVYGPVLTRQEQLEQLRHKHAQAVRQLSQVNRSLAVVNRWRRLSLPADVADAQRLYQQWLTDMALMCGWQELRVVPGRRIVRSGQYTAVQVHLEAVARLDQVARLLSWLDRVALAHRVAALRVEPQGETDQLRVRLTGEGLVLPGAPARKRLFPETRLQEPLAAAAEAHSLTVRSSEGFPQKGPFWIRIGQEVMQVRQVQGTRWQVRRAQHNTALLAHGSGDRVQLLPLQSETLPGEELFHQLAQAWLFRPYRPPQAPPERPSVAPPDPEPVVVFIASVQKDEEPEVWFYEPRTRRRYVLRAGQKWQWAQSQLQVLSIQPDRVVLETPWGQQSLELGQSLQKPPSP